MSDSPSHFASPYDLLEFHREALEDNCVNIEILKISCRDQTLFELLNVVGHVVGIRNSSMVFGFANAVRRAFPLLFSIAGKTNRCEMRFRTNKPWLAFLTIFLAAANCFGQETFYYKNGERIPLTVDHSKNFVLAENNVSRRALERNFRNFESTVEKFARCGPFNNLNRLDNNRAGLANDAPAIASSWAIIEGIPPQLDANRNLANDRQLAYRAPFYKTSGEVSLGISHLLYVKLKQETDRAKLIESATELGAKVVGNNKFMPLWYTLAVDKNSNGNSLEIANKLYESGDFAIAEPDFLHDFKAQVVFNVDPQTPRSNDTHYAQQWGLQNTGQNGGTTGIDTNAPQAWSYATGSSVKVAVLDHGIQLDHPDFANLSSDSFDTVNGTSPSLVRGNHGTACAGIIGATKENNLGIAGIAPDATLMSISDPLLLGPNAQQRLASGLSWAWQNGADVISNSWGHNGLASSFISDAISDALTQGRSGKGCVVVFSAGNSNNAVIFPASDNPSVICVGAMSQCGQRKSLTSCDGEGWGSCFGLQQDIVAPGVLIPTTDRTGTAGYNPSGDYTMTFNGTSSACPHVAAVAALILQVNSGLTQQQVANIIESTAQKVGGYNYQTTTGRPNGTWNNEMGYGLVDAEAAVQMASSNSLVDADKPGDNQKIAASMLPSTTKQRTLTSNRPPTSVAESTKETEKFSAEPGYLQSFPLGPDQGPQTPTDQLALNAGYTKYNNVGVNLNTRLLGTNGTTQISVYARDIRWRYGFGNRPDMVTPTGEGGQGGSGFRFRNAHRFGITIYQGNNYWNVTSTNPNRPTVITGLSNTEPVRITVNDTNGNYSDNYGAFDIYIRKDN